MEVCAEIIVQGLVQGVGFRYFVYHVAQRLGLRGYVKNLPHGDVQVVVEGERGMIEELLADVRVGPRAAHVSRVNVVWKDPSHQFAGFEIR